MRLLLLAIYGLILAFPLAEAIIYPGITVNKIGIQPIWLVAIALLFSLFVRIFVQRKFWETLGIWGFYILGPLITLACLGFRYIEVYTHPNLIFSTIHLSLTQTEQLSLYLLVVCLPLITKNYFTKHIHFTVLAISLYVYHFILLTWSQPDLYILIKKEDGLIEYLTFLAYLIASIFSFLNSRYLSHIKIPNKEKNILIAFSVLSALALLGIAGEEISWGQRIANIEVPESLAAANTQGELNLHNNRMIFGFVYQAYTALNLYGLLSWIMHKPVVSRVSKPWHILVRLATSRWYTMLFFIPNLIYVSLMPYYISSLDLQWEELTELYPALGILVWMTLNLFYLKNRVTLKK